MRRLGHRRGVGLVALGLLLAACAPAPSAALGTISGTLTAGPVCPVVSDPPDPACADRAVAGAQVLLLDDGDREAGRATSAADGTYVLAAAPGTYRLVPQPVEGLLGTAGEQTFVVRAGATTVVDLSYDTGIR